MASVTFRFFSGRLPGHDAAAVVPHVHLHEDVELDALLPGSLGEVPHVQAVLDGDYDVAVLGEAHEPGDLGLPDHLVGDENVPNARLRHGLRLPQLGAGDAYGARLYLFLRDYGGLVGLGVRP
jgi:hypothetical protein